MTSQEFNKKYNSFLQEDSYGLSIDKPQLTIWLDTKFENFIKRPNFKFSQIKAKFGRGRFYCEGLSEYEIKLVEDKITEDCLINPN